MRLWTSRSRQGGSYDPIQQLRSCQGRSCPGTTALRLVSCYSFRLSTWVAFEVSCRCQEIAIQQFSSAPRGGACWLDSSKEPLTTAFPCCVTPIFPGLRCCSQAQFF